ncbi:hypothetical protein R3X26_15635 [Vibrio sp. TH_r3]|uniref:hypothetical protein n=1 Tax=Vibrio sp. TH_r3 TaxID=3082084 RepID=UPI002955235D|nr:hypothetical protein [Vibrio sp. TH_r3]MDV7105836.1 hypothetical protein [Vibrio sp. TH_r3]
MTTDKTNDCSATVNDKQHDKVMDDFNRSVAELDGLWQELLKLQVHSKQWSKSTIELFFLELSNSVAACKRAVACQLIFISLFMMFLFSASVGVGVVIYSFTSNLAVSYGGFILSLGLILVGLVLFQKYVIQFIGFHHTKQQVEEGIDVLAQFASKKSPKEKVGGKE